MRAILIYLKEYLYAVNKSILLFCTLFTAVLIYFNYHYGIDEHISNDYSFKGNFIFHYLIFLTAFLIPYLLITALKKHNYFSNPIFLFLILLAPAIFAFKTAINFDFHFFTDHQLNTYWSYISYWPLLGIITIGFLFILWRIFNSDQSFYGIKIKGVEWKPYWLMLLIMIPLVAVASTQPDFLHVYPKMKLIAGMQLKDFSFWQTLLFELSYGSDFITIELFFRGFLILAFIKWAGKEAILPMTSFYCIIHFGKPLSECISSYFGGIILGVIVYNTRSILGGLIVHLGLAWLMEIGGYIGNQLFKGIP